MDSTTSPTIWTRPTLIRIFGSAFQTSDKHERSETLTLMLSEIHNHTFPIDDFAEMLTSPDVSLREPAALILSELGRAGLPLLPLVPILLKDQSPLVRQLCIDWLMVVRGISVPIRSALTCAAECLSDSDGLVRFRTVQFIDNLDDDTYGSAFNHPHSFQASELGGADGRISRIVEILSIVERPGDKCEQLCMAFCDPLPHARVACMLAARRIFVGCDDLILEGAHDVNADVRATAALMASSFPSIIWRVVAHGLSDSDRLMRINCLLVVRNKSKSQPPPCADILTHVTACLGDSDEGIQTAAIGAMKGMSGHKNRTAMLILEMAKHSTERVRRRALKAVEDLVWDEPLIPREIVTSVVEIIEDRMCDQESRHIGVGIISWMYQKEQEVPMKGAIESDEDGKPRDDDNPLGDSNIEDKRNGC